jgi:ribosomal protein S18 acetylase RimI-like enzyme
VHVRPTVPADRDAVARLLVQLYAFEVPGMMRGAEPARTELARRIVAATPAGLRFVLERDGVIVGMGSIGTSQEPRPSTPPKVVLQAPAVLGPVHGLRTIVGAARGVLSVAAPPAANEAQLHSLVVDRRYRGQGLGGLLLARLEDEALARGRTHAVLQVVTSNRTAQDFYRSRGYQPVADPPVGIRRVLGYPTIVMHKDLQQPAG